MRIPLDHIQHGACHASMYAACKSPHPPRLSSINPLQVSVYDVALVNEAHAPGRILKHLQQGELSSGQAKEEEGPIECPTYMMHVSFRQRRTWYWRGWQRCHSYRGASAGERRSSSRSSTQSKLAQCAKPAPALQGSNACCTIMATLVAGISNVWHSCIDVPGVVPLSACR